MCGHAAERAVKRGPLVTVLRMLISSIQNQPAGIFLRQGYIVAAATAQNTLSAMIQQRCSGIAWSSVMAHCVACGACSSGS